MLLSFGRPEPSPPSSSLSLPPAPAPAGNPTASSKPSSNWAGGVRVCAHACGERSCAQSCWRTCAGPRVRSCSAAAAGGCPWGGVCAAAGTARHGAQHTTMKQGCPKQTQRPACIATVCRQPPRVARTSQDGCTCMHAGTPHLFVLELGDACLHGRGERLHVRRSQARASLQEHVPADGLLRGRVGGELPHKLCAADGVAARGQ